MLKKRDLNESQMLFELMSHPEVFPFVRHKAYSYEQFIFMTKQIIEAEERGELISRTIIDEWSNPIGTINLYDIENKSGFLGTWIGKPFHGKGYNKPAKDEFLKELFYLLEIQTVFMRIRKENIRSQKAAKKLPYIVHANETRKAIYDQLNQSEDKYELFEIPKDLYAFHVLRQVQDSQQSSHLLEA